MKSFGCKQWKRKPNKLKRNYEFKWTAISRFHLNYFADDSYFGFRSSKALDYFGIFHFIFRFHSLVLFRFCYFLSVFSSSISGNPIFYNRSWKWICYQRKLGYSKMQNSIICCWFCWSWSLDKCWGWLWTYTKLIIFLWLIKNNLHYVFNPISKLSVWSHTLDYTALLPTQMSIEIHNFKRSLKSIENLK